MEAKEPRPVPSEDDGEDWVEDVNEGKVLEVVLAPLLGNYADDSITVENTPPDYVFAPPRKPPPPPPSPLSESKSPVASGFAMLLERTSPAWNTSTSYFVSTCLIFAVSAGLTLLVRRGRARGRLFTQTLNNLEISLDSFPLEPARDRALREGTLQDREQEILNRVGKLEDLIAAGREVTKNCPWDARGHNSRRLGKYLRALSARMQTIEKAAEEIGAMIEVERLVRVIDGGGALDRDSMEESGEDFMEEGGEDDNDTCCNSERSDGGGSRHSDGTVGRPTRPERRGGGPRGSINDAAVGVDGDVDSCRRRRGNGWGVRPSSPSVVVRGDRRGAAGLLRRPGVALQPRRLHTRINAMLAVRTDGKDRCCVFKAELRLCGKVLTEKEQAAMDKLKLGLRQWNLHDVDRALAELKTLELRDVASSFEHKRDDVRSKRWRLRQELWAAQNNEGTESYASMLRDACVKAETFFATDLPEYESAKQSLQNLRAANLEMYARKCLITHHLVPQPGCNVSLDGDGKHALLMLGACLDGRTRGLLQEESSAAITEGGFFDANCSSGGVARRLSLGSQGMHDGDDDCANETVDVCGGYRSSSSGTTTVNGVVAGPTATMRNGMQPFAGANTWGVNGREGGSIQQQQQQQLAMMMNLRGNAQGQFLEYVTQQKDKHAESCDMHRKALQKEEDAEARHQENIAHFEARHEQEERRLRLEEERQWADEDERQIKREEQERKMKDERLAELWSADAEFFWGLTIADFVISAVTIAWCKGFSLAPEAAWDALWGVVVAECRDDAGPLLVAAAPGIITYDGFDGTDVGNDDDSMVWWAWSTVGSAAAVAVQAGYSTIDWCLGHTLSLMASEVTCEIRAALGAAAWLGSLVLALYVAALLGVDGCGPLSANVRCAILAVWVWARFHVMLVDEFRQLFLPVVAAPVLVLAYGPILRYVESHLRPGGYWWWGGWDARPLISRFLPVLVTALVAGFLGSQVG